MNRSFAVATIATLVAATSIHATSVGAGGAWVTGEVADPKHEYADPFRFSSPAWTFELVDPSGSIFSFLSTASSNHARRLGAQQRAEESARNGGTGTAAYEVSNSVRSTGSTQTLRVVWAHNGSFEYRTKDRGWRTDDGPDLMMIQVGITGGVASWQGLAGMDPLSFLVTFEGQGGYLEIQDRSDTFDGSVQEGWFLFPFSAQLAYDAPLGLTPYASVGYDPITGLISVWSKSVHQAWRWSVGADWQALPWLAAEVGYGGQTTNISDEEVWAFTTNTLSFGARVDFDGF